MSTVTLIWKCTKPNSQAMVQLCESLMTKAAQTYGMNTAVIRKEVHDTTKVNGQYVRTVPHITGDIIDTTVNKGYALHWNLDSSRITPLASQPPTAPNPEMWELVHKSGKGFILSGDTTEAVREM